MDENFEILHTVQSGRVRVVVWKVTSTDEDGSRRSSYEVALAGREDAPLGGDDILDGVRALTEARLFINNVQRREKELAEVYSQ
jgi:hypothetical protein